ncbi:CU044_2847 family protein [Streptomyces sp. NPDC058683]|uniref:CU044_2847 family protein n=1 Tax=Streptomyces sp. NPDC058683 TaxID=3346597 RepID=UPI003653B881
MDDIVRMPLEGGGSILFEGATGAEGPVKAGRLGSVIGELPATLQATLGPVRDTARVILEQLRQAGPDEVEVEFGVDLSAQAGAVITKAETGCHVTVRMVWRNDEPHDVTAANDGGTSDSPRRTPQGAPSSGA